MTWKTTPHVAYSVFDKDGEEISSIRESLDYYASNRDAVTVE